MVVVRSIDRASERVSKRAKRDHQTKRYVEMIFMATTHIHLVTRDTRTEACLFAMRNEQMSAPPTAQITRKNTKQACAARNAPHRQTVSMLARLLVCRVESSRVEQRAHSKQNAQVARRLHRVHQVSHSSTRTRPQNRIERSRRESVSQSFVSFVSFVRGFFVATRLLACFAWSCVALLCFVCESSSSPVIPSGSARWHGGSC